ncbi:hypothetical protein [Allocoleopsis sp.]|uniref:hypothetical protein n=1 Tax=Allocoleopsis sp. TaxID=3088169 RepID=UPI002FD24FC8
MQSPILCEDLLEPKTRAFYRRSLDILLKSQIPFLLGGTYAFERYTGIARYTKDLDIFVRPSDCQPILEVLSKHGYCTEITAPHWLAKAFCGEDFIDIIFNGANGNGEVDDIWLEYAIEEEVLGMPVRICAAEEIIWSKAFIMARDRFDGADIAHLILACSHRLDWSRLLQRFGSQWRVLFSHLILFGFIYPGERSRIPKWVMNDLFQRLQEELISTPEKEKLCQGTLLSPLQYRIDLEQWGYQDARLSPRGNMTATEISEWTAHLIEDA